MTALDVVFYIAGSIIVLLGVLDVFLTVLAYDAGSVVIGPGYRVAWRAVNQLARRLPHTGATFLRTSGAPLMVIGSVGIWMSLLIVGFALIYYPAVRDGTFALQGLTRSFWSALYVSASSITSLGFNGVQPNSTLFFLIAASETLIGLTSLTLLVTYVLGLYRVVQDAAVTWVTMQNHAGRDDSPSRFLEPYFRAGSTNELSPLWSGLHTRLAEYLEGMRRYPVVYYFHTRHRNRTLPAMLRLISEAAAAVRWGLPEDHPAAKDPWLPGLLEAYLQAADEISHRFLPAGTAEPSAAASEAAFDRACTGDASEDAGVKDFLRVQRTMRSLAELDEGDLSPDAYRRYTEWWGFIGRARALVDAVAADFGETATTGDRDASPWKDGGVVG